MPISGGQIIDADTLNHLKPTTYLAEASATQTGVIVDTDVTGATQTFTTETDNAVYTVVGTFDMDWQGAAISGNVISGKLAVDGVIQAREAHGEQSVGAAGDRFTGAQVWRGTLATAGSHTIKLVVSIPSANQRTTTPHTALLIEIHEVV